MSKKKLPIGIQTFSDIVNKEENYVYVDKTDIAYNLIDNGRYYFLSRPRRFGKSLFIDTLKCIFEGKKELFQGLAIYDKWNWDNNYPVISIDFNEGELKSEEGIRKRIYTILKYHREKFDVDCEDKNDIPSCFKELIVKVSKKFNSKVVILIDEYDKPILENIVDNGSNEKSIAEIARDILRTFYGVIKSSDEYLKFVMLTGVSKFSKMNLFSGLNNLDDITLDSNYATITGYTHNELQSFFYEYLEDVDLEKVREWYNGYNYFGEPIYNPFDILLFFSKNKEYRNYWWETGNPKFLIDILKTQDYHIPKLESITVSSEQLSSFDVERIDLVALLWQTGYLTFDRKVFLMEEPYYKMKVPNMEIQRSLNTLFLDYLVGQDDDKTEKKISIYNSIMEGDFDKLEISLKSLFSAIPYNNYVKNTISNFEGYYSSVIFTMLSSLGLVVITEDTTNRGRIDLTLKAPNATYLFEFKVDSKEKPIEQIKSKKYYEKYLSEKKDIFMVGISFSSQEKNIVSFEVEKV